MISYQLKQRIYNRGQIILGRDGGMIYLQAAIRLDQAGISPYTVCERPIEVTAHGVVFAQIVLNGAGKRVFRNDQARRRGKLLTNQGKVI